MLQSLNRRPSTLLLAVMACLVLIGHLPLALEHLANVLLKPHYQFLAIVPIASLLLLRKQSAASSADLAHISTLPSLTLCAIGFFVTASLLSAAIYLTSPWIAMASLLFACLVTAYTAGGVRLLRLILSPWFMLVLLLPPPLDFDSRLIQGLRSTTTYFSSGLLDQIGVVHLVRGNVIQLPKQILFLADACSGINSLFVLTGFTLFFNLWFARGPIRLFLLTIVTIWVVLVENVIRVACVAVAENRGFTLSTGWQHTVLGFGLFIISVLILLVSDHALSLLRMPHIGRHIAALALYPRTSLRRPVPAFCCVGVACVFVGLGFMQLTQMHARGSQWNTFFSSQDYEIESMEKALTAWNDWEVTSFKMETRVKDDPTGEYSQIWLFKKGNLLARISIDYPFYRVHDLTPCYEAIGWQSLSRSYVPSNESRISRVQLESKKRGTGLLLFSLFNSSGAQMDVLPQDAPLTSRLSNKGETGGPWYQVQLLSSGLEPPNEHEERELVELYQHCWNLLKARVLKIKSRTS